MAVIVHQIVQWVACKLGRHFRVTIGDSDPFCLWCGRR